jgi:hypothetical protein
VVIKLNIIDCLYLDNEPEKEEIYLQYLYLDEYIDKIKVLGKYLCFLIEMLAIISYLLIIAQLFKIHYHINSIEKS